MQEVATRLGPRPIFPSTAIHCRAAAAASAALGALVTTPTVKNENGTVVYPKSVRLQVESAGAATYYTLNGTAASATNGFLLPTAPSYEEFPFPELISNVKNGAVSASNPQICLFSAGSQVQVLWLF